MLDQIRHSFEQIQCSVIQIRQVLLACTPGRQIWLKLWRKWMPIDEIVFAVSCSATVIDEFELQLTKLGDKARNWMFQNWSTKDEIETSIRTFQSIRDEIESTFSKNEWRDDENGRENLYYFSKSWKGNSAI